MPMNKAERAELHKARLRAALSWPAMPPAPVSAMEIAHYDGDYFRGWWMNPHRGVDGGVGRGIVDGNNHTTSDYTDEQMRGRYSRESRISMSQGAGGPWYWTEAQALAALHYALATQAAETLLAMEERIELAQARAEADAAALMDLARQDATS